MKTIITICIVLSMMMTILGIVSSSDIDTRFNMILVGIIAFIITLVVTSLVKQTIK